MSALPRLVVGLGLLGWASACQSVEQPGPWREPLQGGVIHQATRDVGGDASAVSVETAKGEPPPVAATSAPPTAPPPSPPMAAVEAAPSANDEVVDRWSTDPLAGLGGGGSDPASGGLAASPPPGVAVPAAPPSLAPSSVAPPSRVPLDPSSVLPEPPPSDREALAALEGLGTARAGTGAAQSGLAVEPLTPCEAPPPTVDTIPFSDLTLVRLWREGALGRAEVKGPDGRLHLLVRGDRIGAEGGRVLAIQERSIVVGTIGFGMDDRPILVQEAMHLGR